MNSTNTYTAFEGNDLFCRGTLEEVVKKVKRNKSQDHILIFNDSTGKTMDFNFQGSEKEVLKRLEIFIGSPSPSEYSGPGRPKLGVVSREVSLLPRHWEWLAAQPGGASATLRRLVEEGKKKEAGASEVKLAQERTYKFMSVMAGDLPGYEEALRALYRKEKKTFLSEIKTWPPAIQSHAIELASEVF